MITTTRSLIFDVDGTLINSAEGIIRSAQYGFKQLGLPVPEYDAMYRFIGPPLLDTYQNDFGLTEEQAQSAVSFYRERYHEKGVHEAFAYYGMGKLLADLRSAGFHLFVATSKPEGLAKDFLALHDLAEYFEVICGADDKTRSSKDKVIEYLLPKLPEEDRKTALMIGDRKFDILGAAKFSLPSVGVRYGFAEDGEFEKAGATYVVDTVEELRRLLLG